MWKSALPRGGDLSEHAVNLRAWSDLSRRCVACCVKQENCCNRMVFMALTPGGYGSSQAVSPPSAAPEFPARGPVDSRCSDSAWS